MGILGSAEHAHAARAFVDYVGEAVTATAGRSGSTDTGMGYLALGESE